MYVPTDTRSVINLGYSLSRGIVRSKDISPSLPPPYLHQIPFPCSLWPEIQLNKDILILQVSKRENISIPTGATLWNKFMLSCKVVISTTPHSALYRDWGGSKREYPSSLQIAALLRPWANEIL